MSVLLLAAGIVLVVVGAELFFEAIVALARRLEVSPFALTALLSGFEVENLAAGIVADLKGLPGAAAGTFLGGTTFLALGVAGVAALIRPVRAELPPRALATTAAAPLPLFALALDRTLSRADGAILLVWFALAMALLWRGAPAGAIVGSESEPRAATRLAVGLGLLALGGEVLGRGLRAVVSGFGISETLLGNTVIAASVEAEEVVRVSVPARRGSGDVALGNVVGTIVHFVAFNAGAIALVKPLELDEASRTLHLPAAVASAVVFASVVAARGGLGRPAAAALVSAYGAYVAAAVALA